MASSTLRMPRRAKSAEFPSLRRRRILSGTDGFAPPSLDLDDVLRAVVASAAELTGAALVVTWTANEDARVIHRRVVSDPRLARDYPIDQQLYGRGIAGWIALHRRPQNLADIAADPRVLAPEWFKNHDLTSYLGLPIVFENTLLGVLSLLGRAPFALGPGERRRLRAFIVQAAAAIRNARLFEATEARRQSAEALAEVGRVISQGLDPDLVAARIADSVQGLLGALTAAVYRHAPEPGGLDLLAQSTRPDLTFDWARHFGPGEGMVGLAVRDGRTVTTVDLASDPRIVYAPDVRARLEQVPYRAVLAVPLLGPDRIHGVLGVADLAGRLFTREEIELAETFAAQASVALENARLYGEAERRRREAELFAELSRSVNESLDVDVVLHRVAAAIEELCRSDLARIALRDPEAEGMRIRYWVGAPSDTGLTTVIEPGMGVAGHVLATGRPARTADYLNDPRFTQDFAALARARGLTAIMSVPIVIAGRIEGLLIALNRSPRAFSDHDEAVLVRLAHQAATAIHNAQLFAREQRARSEAEASERALAESESRLRASEERYRSLVEHAPDAIVVFDARADRFIEVNEQAVRLYGLSREELLRRGPLELCPLHQPDGRTSAEASQHWIRRALEGHTPTFEWMHRDGAGALVPCEVSLVRIPDASRLLIRASLFNIAERKRAEERHARLEEELRQAQKMEAVGRLAGGVAHDFNNLLTVIGGRTDLMAQRLRPEDPLRHDLDLIAKTAERAAALTRQLLAFSRKQVMQPKRLDLNGVVRGLEQMLRRLIGEDIEIVTELAPDLGLVQADPAQIDQVIMNLIVNARDAMAHGGRLTLRTANVRVDADTANRPEAIPPGAYVVLSVADTGIGMDPKTLEQIFEPFFTTKEVGKGTGLGLSTVYGIVTQSGGHISVESRPGRGTVFTIHLPRVTAADDPRPGAPKADGPQRGQETILLVEDEPDVRDLTHDILETQGYRVLESKSPTEAERICREHSGPIHLLLSDVVMPEMSGRALAARLVAMRPEMRVLYTSGYDDEAIVRHGVLDPDVTLLAKPFTPTELTKKVRAMLA